MINYLQGEPLPGLRQHGGRAAEGPVGRPAHGRHEWTVHGESVI